MRKTIGFLLVLCLVNVFLSPCHKQPAQAPKTIQDRVLEYDPATMSVLIIADRNNNNEKPDFNTLSPQRFELSADVIEKRVLNQRLVIGYF